MLKYKKILNAIEKYIFLLILILIAASCSRTECYDINIYMGLVAKIRELISLCSHLAAQENYYGQIMSRIYYSYYHMARLLCMNKFNNDLESHQKTWKKIGNINSTIKNFGFSIKEIREKHDYYILENYNYSNDINTIISNKNIVDDLINEIYISLDNNIYLSKEDIIILKQDLENLKILHNDFTEKLRRLNYD